MGVGRIAANMYFAARISDGQVGGPWMARAQLPLFHDAESLAAFMRRQEADGSWAPSRTETWEALLQVLEVAKVAGADSVAFLDPARGPIGVEIDEVVEHVRDVLRGRHDGNPECVN